MQVNTPISLGELVDKLTILEIKLDKISDLGKLENIKKEHNFLRDVLTGVVSEVGGGQADIEVFKSELKSINETLWRIEDDIRECERNKDFSKVFIDLARSVYITNDKRAATKNALNLKFGSELIEEKSYEEY